MLSLQDVLKTDPSEWSVLKSTFTQLEHNSEVPSALLTLGHQGQMPTVFFVRIDVSKKVLTIVEDWQDFQWAFWNNLPAWTSLRTNQRRLEWRYLSLI